MHTSKSIAYALIKAIKRGENASLLGEKVLQIYSGTSHAPHLRNIIFYLNKLNALESTANTCHIESAVDLSSKDVSLITEVFGTDRAEVSVNQKILGGFSAMYDGFFYDARITSRFSVLKKVLLK